MTTGAQHARALVSEKVYDPTDPIAARLIILGAALDLGTDGLIDMIDELAAIASDLVLSVAGTVDALVDEVLAAIMLRRSSCDEVPG